MNLTTRGRIDLPKHGEPLMTSLNSGALRSVLFVVPAHNEERHLKRCLESINRQHDDLGNETAISVVVVDNASRDATVEIALGMNAKVVHVQPGNPGRARNAGAAVNQADVIVFVDADCVLPAGWLSHGLAKLSDSGVVAVGSVQSLAPADAPWVERCWVETIAHPRSETWESSSWLPAFNLMIRKADFDAIGGFDESLATCEDSDLSFRLAEKGELFRDSSHPVHHLGESKTLTEFFRREMWRSRGNLRSAWKRGSFSKEIPSLFLPIGYATLFIASLVILIIAASRGGQWKWLLACCAILAIVIPVAVALIKRKRLVRLGSAATLFAAYLLARGIGPFWPSKRVTR